MSQWIKNTKNAIKQLRENGYFNNWNIKRIEHITFHIYPNLEISENWLQERVDIYKKNAEIFNISVIPYVDFYVYPSIDSVKNLGILPAISFLKQKEIHGHLKQSAGHELNHILLGNLNPSENLPANGLWEEALCVYYDGTSTDRKKHTNSIDYAKKILNTPWNLWRANLPSNLYPLAGSIAQYCIEKYGIELVLKFIKNLRDNGTNDENLYSTIFNISYQKLQENWLAWLKKDGSKV